MDLIKDKKKIQLQSAVEFISTYAFVFLAIAVAIAVLYLYSSIPKSTIPTQCQFFSGFSCATALFNANSISGKGSSMYIEGIDTQIGVVNVSTFNAVWNNVNSTTSYCAPSLLIQGEQFFCVANFSSVPQIGTSQSTNFRIQGNYCTNSLGNKTKECSGSKNFSFAGTQTSSIVNLSSASIQLLFSVVFISVPFTITNTQNIPTPAPWQQELNIASNHYSSYIQPNWSNVVFTTEPDARGGVLNAWVEYGASNTAPNTIVWVSMPGGIAADSKTVIYMNIISSTVMSASGPTGEAAQLSPTYGEYDNIKQIMLPGLEYQIYYGTNGICNSTNYENQLYSAPLGQGTTINGCQTFVSSTPIFNTSEIGTTQNVNGGNNPNVIINYQCYHSGGGAFPNPPVQFCGTTPYNSFQIKAIGFIQTNSTNNGNGNVNILQCGTGTALGFGTSFATSNGVDWLGGTSNPSNLINGEWRVNCNNGGSPISLGDYRLEADYFLGDVYSWPGGAYFALYNSKSAYFHAAYPPNGVMPSVLIGYSLESFASTLNPSVMQGQYSQLIGSASGGTTPYTYQWLEEAPGATSFTPISGATSQNYLFTTTTSTPTGTYQFELQTTDSASPSNIATSAPVSVAVNVNTVELSVKIIITNSQSIPTVAPFQQLLNINSNHYSSYINSGWTNVEFTTENAASGNLISTWVENNNTNTAANTLVWLNLSQGIAADSNVIVYMNIMSGSIMSNNGPTGEAAQLSPTYGEYDNIKQIMLPGLEYQIYYGTNGICNSTNYENQLYSAPLGQGTTINGCQTFVSSTPIFNTSEIGTTQNVNGGNNPNVIINYQCYHSGGGAFPNPPVQFCGTTPYNSFQIKAIGFIQTNSTNNGNGNVNILQCGTGTALGFGTSFATSNGVDWLGGTSNPSNLINGEWRVNCNNGGSPISLGDYRLEADYFLGDVYSWPGGAYFALYNSKSAYFHAAYPPNGVMPSVLIGYSLESFASTLNPSVMQGQYSQLIGSASGGTTPYTYQWLEEAPGATSFTPISGATSQNYLFTTTTSTPTGTYQFELQTTDSASPSNIATSAPVSVAVNVNTVELSVKIIITNSQSIPTVAPFQQLLNINSNHYSSYINSGWTNVEFTTENAASGNLISTWVENNNTNTAANTLVWLNLSQGIAADSNVIVYMNIMSGSIMSNNGPTGEAAQLSPTYGEYDNIKQIMLPGLEYQIYYGTNGICNSTNYENQLYSAPLGQGTTINGCQTFVSSTPIFNTSEIGTTQNVNGGNNPNVIINYQCYHSGGGAFPNPPVQFCGTTPYNSFQIKAIGFIQTNSTNNGNGNVNILQCGTGTALGFGTSFATSNGVDWLGGTSNPSNLINGEWRVNCNNGGSPISLGDYRLEADYFLGDVYSWPGGAYFALYNSKSAYFHAAYPPNGVMPSVLIGYSLESFASTLNPSVMQGQYSQLIGSASGGTTPYTYQWLEEAPGATSFTPISGATSQNYLFTTTTSTPTGTYQFELQTTDSASPSNIATSAPVSVAVNVNTVELSVKIIITNSQSIPTVAPFQQLLNINSNHYSSYINSGWTNVEFTTENAASGNLISTWVENNNTNTAANTLVWLNLSQGIAADSNVIVYMNIMSGSIMSNNGPTGEAAQLSPTYGEYDNIKQIMLPGLEYQIYYGTNGICNSTNYENQLYSAPLGQGTTINGCQTFVSSTPIFNTSEIGTTQNVNGGNNPNVIINYQCYHSGGGAFPNPPVQFCGTTPYNSFQIKAIGFIQTNSTNNGNGNVNILQCGTGTALGFGTSFATSNGVDWLGGTSNPSNLINGEWRVNCNNGGSPISLGDYRLEADYFLGDVYSWPGGAYFALYNSKSAYFHAAYPPNGVMPGYYTTLSQINLNESVSSLMQGQNDVLGSIVYGGEAPLTYQWLEEAPGSSSFSAISGATSSSYTFATTSSTATGTYQFELEVTDATGATLTSSPISVTVNTNSVQYSVPITISNAQSTATVAPFQELIYVDSNQYSSYINSGWTNVEFTDGSSATGNILYAWVEANAINTATNTSVWVKLPNGVPASSSVTIYMNFMGSTTIMSNNGPTGEAAQLSSTYGEYDDIGKVMNNGLVYQIYYDPSSSGTGTNSQQEIAIYAASLSSGTGVNANGQTFTSSTNTFETTRTVSSQSVNGANEANVINNIECGYTGGTSFPNPPVANCGNAYMIKELGFAQMNQTSNVSMWLDDGALVGLSTNAPISFEAWLGSVSQNPGNALNEWGGCCGIHTSGNFAPSDYSIEYDYINQGGPAYFSLWSSNSINYYSPSNPPSGVMPGASGSGVS